MKTVISNLTARRKMMFIILAFITLFALIINYTFDIKATSYFGLEYNMYIVYGLISYKVVELGILYLLFYRRHYKKIDKENAEESSLDELLAKFEKNAKRFFMLVPHGSTIFAIISYKLTVNIYIFLLFMLIAVITLFLVNPKNLETTKD